MKHKYLIVLVAIVMIVLAPTTHARADMAPPEPPAGGSLDTGEPSTYVQMVSEEVLMTIGDNGADVKATFNMLNMETEQETLNVRFPAGYNWSDPAKENYPIWGLDIDNFVVYVDGKKTDFTIDHQPDMSFDIWTTWQVTFPPGQLVKVEVSYRGLPNHDADVSFPIYSYILHTGAGWYGTIGEGTVTIRLPYEINEYNILADGFIPQPPFYAINGTDIIWQFTDLEPTGTDDIAVAVMTPAIWLEWQAAEKGVNENPDSVSAHLRLAYALRKAASYSRSRSCAGNCELSDRALQEYDLWLHVIPDEYVLQVLPNIVDYLVDYSDMLLNGRSDESCAELERALALDPANKNALRMKEDHYWCGDVTLSPTATLYSPPGCDPQAGRCPPPTSTPTVTLRPTSTPRPTRTPTVPPTQTVTPTPTATPTPNPQPPSPNLILGALVGIAAVVIAGAVIGMWMYRRKERSAGNF